MSEKPSPKHAKPNKGDDKGFKKTSASLTSSLKRAKHIKKEVFDSEASVGSSAALIGICTVISRITGFFRIWVMAFALGSTLLSASYQVANNVPNMLYELVAGGMLATAFLPVYLSLKRKAGNKGGNAYASNLLSIVFVLLGILALISICFPSFIIWTQSFLTDQGEMTTSVFFFQFFAIQIVFYGASALLSGLLNANRDYLWSSIAPVLNNAIVIVTFLVFAAVAPSQPELALYIIAIGNPLGVALQLVIQIPALRRHGIKLRPRINFHDPALKETLALGVPAVIVMACSFAIVSVQNAAAYQLAENGPSILAYSRLWFTLPYSFLTVPIATALFTELSDRQTQGDFEGVKRGILSGTNQILFFMIPCALYLIVFSTPLITLYQAGAFTSDDIAPIAGYLSVLAVALPFYGVNTYMERVFASIRKMNVFAIFNILAACVQVSLTILTALARLPLETIAIATSSFYVLADICLFAYLKRELKPFRIASLAFTFVRSLVLGLLGASLGGIALWLLQTFVWISSESIAQALLSLVLAGALSLTATFGLALAFQLPEASLLNSLLGKLVGKLTGKSRR